jgi:hypothetical protein
MSPALSGFTDKLYWRLGPGQFAHCFTKSRLGRGYRYISLCGLAGRPTVGGGQGIGRPPAEWRCTLCDVAEINRRGWDSSGPSSPGWRNYLR